MRGVNVHWARGVSLGFRFPALKPKFGESLLLLGARSPRGSVALLCYWETFAKAEATVQASRYTFLGGFELLGPRRGSILSFKNSVFMVTN